MLIIPIKQYNRCLYTLCYNFSSNDEMDEVR